MKYKSILTLVAILASMAILQPASAATVVELVPSQRVIIKITEEMTLDKIIERVYPGEQELWPQIRQKLLETNPASFYQNSDRLITGTRLKLIDVMRIREPEEPIRKVRVGYVAQLEGRASARDDTGRVQQLQINSMIFEGDRIETDLGSQVKILMDDGAEVQLKEDSVLKITEYVITAGYDQNSSSVLDLLRGGLRKITGSIGSSALANYQVQTGLATIGVRGTDYVIKLCRLDDCTRTVSRNDPEAKLHAVVLDGAITLTTDEEVQILMAMGEYGTATSEDLLIVEDAEVPSGFLDQQETQQFNATVQQVAAGKEEESSNTWMWVVGALLLAVGL